MGLRRMLVIVSGLYVIEGFPMGVFSDAWPYYWVEIGLSDSAIGAASGLGMAWTLKVFVSPLLHRFGETRRWIAGCLAMMAGVLFAMPGLDPETATIFWSAVAVFCFASAIQDIAIDAYTIGLVPRGQEGAANSVRVGAYRTGMLLLGGAALPLAEVTGWALPHLLLGVAALAMAGGVFLVPRVDIPAEERPPLSRVFATWDARGQLGAIVAFLLIFRLSDFALGPMLAPFWKRGGFSGAEIYAVRTVGGMVFMIAGTALGGWWVHRRGIGPALLGTGILALASNLAYAAAALPGAPDLGIYAASLTEALCTGLATAAFMSFLMRICEREYATVQYAFLTALYAGGGRLVGMTSGFFTEAMGYAAYFALTALLTLPAFLFLPAARSWIAMVPEEDPMVRD